MTEWQVFAFYIRTIPILIARSLLPKIKKKQKQIQIMLCNSKSDIS